MWVNILEKISLPLYHTPYFGNGYLALHFLLRLPLQTSELINPTVAHYNVINIKTRGKKKKKMGTGTHVVAGESINE